MNDPQDTLISAICCLHLHGSTGFNPKYTGAQDHGKSSLQQLTIALGMLGLNRANVRTEGRQSVDGHALRPKWTDGHLQLVALLCGHLLCATPACQEQESCTAYSCLICKREVNCLESVGALSQCSQKKPDNNGFLVQPLPSIVNMTLLRCCQGMSFIQLCRALIDEFLQIKIK